MLFILSTVLALAGALPAATFEVTASVDRTEVELGEVLRYTLSLQVNGRLDFPVQLETPKFEGFQAQGPGRSDSSSWVTEQHTFVWDLVPIKSGELVLPPVKANAKDAATGEVVKSTPGFTIKVKRPKNAYNGMQARPTVPAALPTYEIQNQAQAPPNLDDSGLHDIKGDRGLPWMALAGVLGAFGAVMALLVWLGRRPGKEEDALPVVKDPRAVAFKQLDAALLRLEQGDERGFAIGAAQALRGYLRQRMNLRHEATLAEAVRACTKRLPDADERKAAKELRFRMELLLYGDAKFVAKDREHLNDSSRALINTMERLAGR